MKTEARGVEKGTVSRQATKCTGNFFANKNPYNHNTTELEKTLSYVAHKTVHKN